MRFTIAMKARMKWRSKLAWYTSSRERLAADSVISSADVVVAVALETPRHTLSVVSTQTKQRHDGRLERFEEEYDDREHFSHSDGEHREEGLQQFPVRSGAAEEDLQQFSLRSEPDTENVEHIELFVGSEHFFTKELDGVAVGPRPFGSPETF